MSYTIDYESKLNEEQLRAVMHHEGPCLVIAGAGTGKTTTLVFRVARLIEDGVKPSSILFLTFTRKAAENMRDRCSDMLDKRCSLINANTFHGFACSVLQRYVVYTGYGQGFTIIDTDDAKDMIGLVKEELKMNSLPFKIPDNGLILAILSKSTTHMMSVDDTIDRYYPIQKRFTQIIVSIAETYSKMKKQSNVMDFDDLLRNLLNLLEENDYVRRTLSEKYRFIMIDEYQDTDQIQARIAQRIAGSAHNIMAVGDDAQSIYAFRGADFRNIMRFPELFDETKVIPIERNYRSTKEILALGNAVMTNASARFEKTLKTDKSYGQRPALIYVDDHHEQSLFIADAIAYHINEGCSLNDIAVLYRNHHYSNDLEAVLNLRRYRYKKFGGKAFGSKKHIRDVMAFMKATVNREDRLSWCRILALYPRIGEKKATERYNKMFIEKEGIEYLRKIGLEGLYHLMISLRIDRESPDKKLKRVAEFYKPFFDINNAYNKNKWKDIETLEMVAANCFSLDELINSLSINGTDEKTDEAESDRPYITLSTIHSAKGLEWRVVFIICFNDGCIPFLRNSEDQDKIDEEVRVFHVAITRAKDCLYLVVPQVSNFKESSGKVSSFLTDEIISELLDVEHIPSQVHAKRVKEAW